MNTKNIAIITGRLGDDPKIHKFENGTGVANFSLATSDTYKNKTGEKVEETDWHDVSVFWGYETIEAYVKKGDLIQVMGSNKTRSYEDKEGNKKYTKYIKADSFTLMSERKVVSNNETESVPDDRPDSDLPF